MRTSRRFNAICNASSGVKLPASLTPPELGEEILPCHPRLLLLGTAHQMADWAIASFANPQKLYTALEYGPEGLAELTSAVAVLSWQELGSPSRKSARDQPRDLQDARLFPKLYKQSSRTGIQRLRRGQQQRP